MNLRAFVRHELFPLFLTALIVVPILGASPIFFGLQNSGFVARRVNFVLGSMLAAEILTEYGHTDDASCTGHGGVVNLDGVCPALPNDVEFYARADVAESECSLTSFVVGGSWRTPESFQFLVSLRDDAEFEQIAETGLLERFTNLAPTPLGSSQYGSALDQSTLNEFRRSFHDLEEIARQCDGGNFILIEGIYERRDAN